MNGTTPVLHPLPVGLSQPLRARDAPQLPAPPITQLEHDIAEQRAALEQLRAQRRQWQRTRRAGKVRIDFYPDPHAVNVINSLRTDSAGGDASSIVNRIILQWREQRQRQRKRRA
jgi:hypothetical protein